MRKIDLLIAMSTGVETIYKDLADCQENITTRSLTLNHIYLLKCQTKDKIDYPIRFATLDGAASEPKGAYILNEALQILAAEKISDKFELHIYGGMEKALANDFARRGNVFYHGKYDVRELDQMLTDIDVGIVPSIWEEAYGYVGVEFIAKGIPVIGNDRGGIPDYTINDYTGWLNRSCSAQELAQRMEEVISAPDKIRQLNYKITADRDRIIKSFDAHGAEIREISDGLRRL